MQAVDPQEFWLLLPEAFLATCGLVLLALGAIGSGLARRVAEWATGLALVMTAFLVVWTQMEAPAEPFLAGLFVLDDFAFYWKLIFLIATGLTVVLSTRFVEDGGYRPHEYYSLILFATTGMMFMASGFSLLSIWISLELMALSSYILAGYFKFERRSVEAALKYFVLGALSSAILLYGISLLYGATGTVQLGELAERLPEVQEGAALLVGVGWVMLAIGLFFKVAAAPFHVWTPDVYVGAPTPVTGYLAVASKAASFAILVRIFYQGLAPIAVDWQLAVAWVAVASMIWGNVAALTQTNVKRMLAYSSIAHAGYLLMGVLAFSESGLWAVMFYMLAYTFFTLGAFGTVILLERREYAGETLADYAGLARRSPGLAAMMLIFLLSLTGLPPTGGFVGKFYLFAAAVESGWTWVALIGVLTSAVSLYYYMGIVVYMYLKDPNEQAPEPKHAPGLVGALAVCAAITVLMGLLPGPVVEFAKASLLLLP